MQTLPTNAAQNTVSYVIDRLCQLPGVPSESNCSASQVVGAAGGNSLDVGARQINASSSVYYRITVRIVGPGSALGGVGGTINQPVSYVQAVVAM